MELVGPLRINSSWDSVREAPHIYIMSNATWSRNMWIGG